MTGWKEAARRALWSGAAASVLSAIALSLCGALENRAPAGPLNGPSQWVWGQRAAHRRRFSLRYTVLSYLIHHLSAFGWATLHEKHVARLAHGRGMPAHVLAAATTATVACFVDYRVARGRLQPGFEKQLSRSALLAVYAAFAIGLAVASFTGQDPRRSRAAR